MLREVNEFIDKTIDFEGSRTDARTLVKAGVSSELDELKRGFDGMEDLLTRASSNLIRSLPESVSKSVSGCVFWPQLGFLTMVCPGHAAPEFLIRNPEREQLNRWAKLFCVGEQAYYKNPQMEELDAHFGDIYGRIIGTPISTF